MIVLIIFSILLILTLSFTIYYAVQSAKSQRVFPPSVNTCPDLWAVSKDAANNVKCYYTGYNNGNYTPNNNKFNVDPTDKKFTEYTDSDSVSHTAILVDETDKTTAAWGSAGTLLCNKQKWASANNIVWTGVNEASC